MKTPTVQTGSSVNFPNILNEPFSTVVEFGGGMIYFKTESYKRRFWTKQSTNRDLYVNYNLW